MIEEIKTPGEIDDLWHSIVDQMIALRVQSNAQRDIDPLVEMLRGWNDDINFLTAQNRKDKKWKDYQNLFTR